MFRRAPLASTLLRLFGLGLLTFGGQARAAVRLGDPLPPHPWTLNSSSGSQSTQISTQTDDEQRELVVLYSHDCGDLGELWSSLLEAGLPIYAVNAEDIATPAPKGVQVWHGPDATAFARALKVSVYPTVLLVRGGRVLNAWQGDLSGFGK